MSDYKQLQIIVIALNRNDNNDDPLTIVRNIAIEEESDRRQIRKAIEAAIHQIEDQGSD
jgi:hypothetical protein